MWTLIILFGLATVNDAHFAFPPTKFETKQECTEKSVPILKAGYDALAQKFGPDGVFVSGKCVQNFHRGQDPDEGEPSPPETNSDSPPGSSTPNTDGQKFR